MLTTVFSAKPGKIVAEKCKVFIEKVLDASDALAAALVHTAIVHPVIHV